MKNAAYLMLWSILGLIVTTGCDRAVSRHDYNHLRRSRDNIQDDHRRAVAENNSLEKKVRQLEAERDAIPVTPVKFEAGMLVRLKTSNIVGVLRKTGEGDTWTVQYTADDFPKVIQTCVLVPVKESEARWVSTKYDDEHVAFHGRWDRQANRVNLANGERRLIYFPPEEH